MEFRVGKVENVEFKVDPSFWRVDTFELDGPTYLKEVELFFGEKIDFMVVKKKNQDSRGYRYFQLCPHDKIALVFHVQRAD